MTSRRTRERLISRLRQTGIDSEQVLEAIRSVPRHLFIEEALSSRAYEDIALPIGHGQTISQPFIVALMTQALLAQGPIKRVLEVGTGCGYQTAVLSSLVKEVHTLERIEPLLASAKRRLLRLNHRNIKFKLADGSMGWPERGPYQGIIVTAAPAEVPQLLLQQLALNGRMIIPVGDQATQELLLIKRDQTGFTSSHLQAVSFVPLIKG